MQKIIDSPQREKLNASYMQWSKKEALKSSQRRMTRDCVKASYGLMLLPLTLVLASCATQSPVTCKQPEPTPMPALSEPMPLVNYSLSAVRAIQKWQASLIDSTATE